MPFMPPFIAPTFHHDAESALDQVRAIYAQQINHLREAMQRFVAGEAMPGRVRACYPYVRIQTDSVVPQAALENSGLSYGFVASAGRYETTLTRPDLYGNYYLQQFRLLLQNHGMPLEVGTSHEPMPIHFSFAEHDHIEGNMPPQRRMMMRDLFDLPDLSTMDDGIANGTVRFDPGQPLPLSLFTAPRVDYSLHRLRHYTGSTPDWFQNFVLFTNYQFYIDEFMKLGHEQMNRPDSEYIAFVEPGNVVTRRVGLPREPLDSMGAPLPRLPQMPAYHLIRPGHGGITMVNIGVGPSNAKNITDHVAVLRPHAWLMLGHCAGLRNSQRLGDYVLAHAYLRQDHVLDADLPREVPVPALAEIQTAIERAVGRVTGLTGYDLKRVMRTGTVATVDDRNWELRPSTVQNLPFIQSRAIALDMESGTIAANGFRFRVPYGTLLCVSDKPLHGQLKLPGMADSFYRERVSQHLAIGLETMALLRETDRAQ